MEDRMIALERTVARIEVQVQNVDSRLTEILTSQAENKAMLVRALHGRNGDPGLVVRTDRLEQWKARTSKITGLILGAVSILFVNKAWDIFTRGGQ